MRFALAAVLAHPDSPFRELDSFVVWPTGQLLAASSVVLGGYRDQ